MFQQKGLPVGFPKAQDAVLERQVTVPGPYGEKWVPIVPDGLATQNLSWRRWCFLQVHVGTMGAHRGVNQTLSSLKQGMPR